MLAIYSCIYSCPHAHATGTRCQLGQACNAQETQTHASSMTAPVVLVNRQRMPRNGGPENTLKWPKVSKLPVMQQTLMLTDARQQGVPPSVAKHQSSRDGSAGAGGCSCVAVGTQGS